MPIFQGLDTTATVVAVVGFLIPFACLSLAYVLFGPTSAEGEWREYLRPVAGAGAAANDEAARVEAVVDGEVQGGFGEELGPAPLVIQRDEQEPIQLLFNNRVHRGTRGRGRRVARSGVTFCSLEDQALAIILVPGWSPSPTNLASLSRELLNHHRRDGCQLHLANGVLVNLEPGQGMGQVARAVREMTRVGGYFLGQELPQLNSEQFADAVVLWENHYRQLDNTAGDVGLYRRMQLMVCRIQRSVFGSVDLPPRE